MAIVQKTFSQVDPDFEFGELLDEVIQKQEGGFVLSRDADGGDGGWTFAGVTARTFNGYCHERGNDPLNYEEMQKALYDESDEMHATIMEEIYDIYAQEYVKPLQLGTEGPQLCGPLLSCAINCGTHTALHLLVEAQRDCFPGASPLHEFCILWENHYHLISLVHPEKKQYLKGWYNRINYWLVKAGMKPLSLEE